MGKKLRLDIWNGSFWKEKHILTKVKRGLMATAGISATGAAVTHQLQISEMITLIELGITFLSTFGVVAVQIIEAIRKPMKPNQNG